MHQANSHRRKNLLTGEWVLVSPQRLSRPWLGQVEGAAAENLPRHDPACSLCPGTLRSGGLRNPDYQGSFAFDNDYPALSSSAIDQAAGHPLFVSAAETGCCRVLCYSERHDLRLATMDTEQASAALEFMFGEFAALDQRPELAYVQLFENRGAMMGCSMPHPHAQVWATSTIPDEPARESFQQLQYFQESGKSLLMDYLKAELEDGQRIVCANEHAVSLVPFWAIWPYETLLLPRRAMAGPEELSSEERRGLAEVLRQTLRSGEELFKAPLPYSMGFHPRPSDGKPHPEWQFHAHVYPPLLRSAAIRKHLVGFEMLGMPQRDITPEAAAAALRKALDESNNKDHKS